AKPAGPMSMVTPSVVVHEPTPNPAGTPYPAATPGGGKSKKGGYIGRVFGDRYEVKQFLGSGGFGATYVSFDRRFKRECVVKILRPSSSSPTPFEIEMRKRFTNEAVTLAHLLHPNVSQ